MTERPPDALGHRVQRVQRALDDQRTVAEAGDGAVRLTLTADGRLVALELAPRALGFGAQRVASLVTQAHERAYVQARRAADEVLASLTDDPLVARALDLASPAARAGDAGGREAAEGARSSFLEDPLGRRDG